jgi:AcrR family transcriptional regulator
LTRSDTAGRPVAAPAVAAGKRARSLEDKDIRRSQLIAAAAGLFAQADFDAVTIAQVAARAGVAKGTAYLYFKNKETLFLELLQAELSGWASELFQSLAQLQSDQPVNAVPMVIARSLAQKPVLCRLLVLLHSVIEPHIDEASALAFKVFLRDLLAQASTSIAEKIPGLRRADASTLMLQTHALVISVTQLASPPPVIARVLAQDASLQDMCIDFEPFLTQTLQTLVRGMVHSS